MSSLLLNGEIDINKTYTLSRLKEITGCDAAFFRAARSKGLRVHYVGRTAFILGRDFIDYLTKNSKRER